MGGLVLVSQADLVGGDVINIDFQSPNAASVDAAGGDGPFSQAGTPTWNIVFGWGSDGTPINLFDTGGEDDGITLSVTANGGWFSPTYTSESPDSAIFDYFQENVEDSMPFSFDNVPAGDYELYVMAGTSQWSEGATTVVSVTGQEDQNITWTGASDLPSGAGWTAGVNYVKFDISLDSSGSIEGIINGDTDTTFLHGMQLRMASGPGASEPTRITAVTTPEGSIEVAISFASTPNTLYSIESSTDLIGWLELDDAVLASPDSEITIFTTTEEAPAPETKFYRVIPNTP